MKLSVDLIAESMAIFNVEVLLAQDREFMFSGIQMLSEETSEDLREDILYISQPKMLNKLSKAKFRNHFFVFKARSQQLERYKQFVNAIVFDEVFSHNDVINHLLNLFNRMNRFEEDLHYASVCTDGPEQIMRVAERMFPDHALIVAGSAYNIIASINTSEKTNDYIKSILNQGYYDRASLKQMASHGYFEDEEKFVKPVLIMPPNICGVPVMLRSYHKNGLFSAFIALYFFGGKPTYVDIALFECFSRELDTFFELSGYYRNNVPKRQQMIEDLITNVNGNTDLVSDRCQSLGIPQQGNFRLGYIEFATGSKLKSSHLVIQLRTWCTIPNYGIFQYNNAIIILMSDWHSSTMPDRMSFIDKWIDMLELLSSNNAKISVSLLFTNMWNLRSAYLQATYAMSIGKYMHPLDTEYHYSKYYIYDMLDTYRQKLPLTDIYVQYLDKLSSEKAAGRSDLILLYNYLCSERNISLTAKKSYMHRNSIIYRLQKIQDELELNLDDDDVRLRLLISFKILEMENKIKLEEPHETHETRQSRIEKFKIPE